MLLWILPLVTGVPAGARAADEPVASAAIPPPPAESPAMVAPTAATPASRPKRARPTSAAEKPTGAPKSSAANASPAKPSPTTADAWKRIVRSAASRQNEAAKHATAQKPSRHVKRERNLQFARASSLPHYPPRPRYYYPGAPVTGPDFDGPPSWYDRGPPGYPRGPW